MVLPIPLLFALALPSTVLSSPLNVMKTHALADSVHVPLLRRSDLAAQSGEQALARAREVIRQKYGVPDALEKRQSVSQVVSRARSEPDGGERRRGPRVALLGSKLTVVAAFAGALQPLCRRRVHGPHRSRVSRFALLCSRCAQGRGADPLLWRRRTPPTPFEGPSRSRAVALYIILITHVHQSSSTLAA